MVVARRSSGRPFTVRLASGVRYPPSIEITPPDYLHYLIRGLAGGDVIEAGDRDLLVRHGLIEPGRSSVVLTLYGERFLAAFLGRT